MPEHLIRPYEAFGPIGFDMAEADLIQAVGPPDESGDRFGFRELIYHQLSLSATFDGERGFCHSVEQLSLLGEYRPVLPDGLALIGEYDALLAELIRRRYDVRVDDMDKSNTIYCVTLGVALWRDDYQEALIDTVMAWSEASAVLVQQAANAYPLSARSS